MPPSTTMTWPLTKSEAGAARNTAVSARSFGLPQRPAGVRRSLASDASKRLCRCRAAGVTWGIPSEVSRQVESVARPSCPALDHTMAAQSGDPVRTVQLHPCPSGLRTRWRAGSPAAPRAALVPPDVGEPARNHLARQSPAAGLLLTGTMVSRPMRTTYGPSTRTNSIRRSKEEKLMAQARTKVSSTPADDDLIVRRVDPNSSDHSRSERGVSRRSAASRS